MSALLFLLALAHPLSAWLGFTLGGVWIYATLLLSLVIYPSLEALFPTCRFVPPVPDSISSRAAELILHLAALSCLGLVLWMLYFSGRHALSYGELTVLFYSVGLSTGSVGITISHELMHRRAASSRALSLALLLTANYPQFKLQHLRRHHFLVGLAADPASARAGQSVYAFYGQSLFGGSRDIFLSECERSGQVGLRRLDPRVNHATRYVLYLFVLHGAIASFFGLLALALFILQGLTAIFVLETINYIQHYGLERTSANERVGYRHAWDSEAITNYALFNLGLHADHHVKPGKHFHSLASSEQTPKMPSGYFTMAFLAMFPLLWRRLMDPKVEVFSQEYAHE